MNAIKRTFMYSLTWTVYYSKSRYERIHRATIDKAPVSRASYASKSRRAVAGNSTVNLTALPSAMAPTLSFAVLAS